MRKLVANSTTKVDIDPEPDVDEPEPEAKVPLIKTYVDLSAEPIIELVSSLIVMRA